MISKFIWRKLWVRPSLISSRLRFLSTRVSDEETSFGSYSVILPEEPFVWGVSHILPRSVPSSIGRPPYAQTLGEEPYRHSSRNEHSQGSCEYDSQVRLGSEEEAKLRASSKLARKVREFSGTLVRVGNGPPKFG